LSEFRQVQVVFIDGTKKIIEFLKGFYMVREEDILKKDGLTRGRATVNLIFW